MKISFDLKKMKLSVVELYIIVGVFFILNLVVNIYTFRTIRAVGRDYDTMSVLYKELRFNLASAQDNLNDTVLNGKQKDPQSAIYPYLDKAMEKAEELNRLQTKIDLNEKLKKLKETAVSVFGESKPEGKKDKLKEYLRDSRQVIGILDQFEEERAALLNMEIGFTSFISVIALFVCVIAFAGIFFVIYINNRSFNLKEAKLNSVNANFHAIMQGLDSVLFTFDSAGVIQTWNENAEWYFDLKKEDAVGKNLYKSVPAFQSFKTFFDKVLYSQQRQYNYHERIHINKGPVRIVDMLCVPMLAKSGGKEQRSLLVKMDDITSFFMEESHSVQVRSAQLISTSMENVQKESAELNGQMNGVLQGLNEIAAQRELTNEVVPYTSFISHGLAELSMIPQKYASTLQLGKLNSVPIDLNVQLIHTLQICLKTFDPCITVELSQNESKSWINADSQALSKAFFCLLSNAAEAVTEMRPEGEEQGGIISVSVEKIAGATIISDRIMRFRQAAKEQPYWVVMISDTGVGIPEDVLPSIYDMFFTTKSPENHKGLGLSVAASIVNELGGYIDVNTKVGGGSVFKVYLPEIPGMGSEAEDADAMSLSADDDKIVYGQGTVLFVNDDIFMHQITSRLIGRFGYQVVPADNGFAALDIYGQDLQSEERSIQAVVCGLSSGTLQNADFVAQLKQMDPSVKIAVLADSEQDENAEQLRAAGVDAFILRPYSLPDFSRTLAELIPQDGQQA
ncbi:MAG: PAS domain-containing protein [Lentisphaeria bacterium]|nr:PAS domain-containing protein [Lentisphaeria bacterium]